MVWFFTRGIEEIQLETRYEAGPNQFVLEIRRTNGGTATERFNTLGLFTERIEALEKELNEGRWTQVGGPEILPSGWRGPIPH